MSNDGSTRDIQTADDVERYLCEIGATPLLNADQEAELARRMNAGRAAARRLESGEQISPQLHITLTAEIAGAHDTRSHLIQAKLWLVVSIAKKYKGHGLADGQHRTLEQVGAAFGITRERVRQIEAEALRKLRHPHLSRPLRRYMD